MRIISCIRIWKFKTNSFKQFLALLAGGQTSYWDGMSSVVRPSVRRPSVINLYLVFSSRFYREKHGLASLLFICFLEPVSSRITWSHVINVYLLVLSDGSLEKTFPRVIKILSSCSLELFPRENIKVYKINPTLQVEYDGKFCTKWNMMVNPALNGINNNPQLKMGNKHYSVT